MGILQRQRDIIGRTQVRWTAALVAQTCATLNKLIKLTELHFLSFNMGIIIMLCCLGW